MPRAGKIALGLVLVAFLATGAVVGANHLFVNQWTQAALDSDSRNASFEMTTRYRYYVDPTTLIIDLTEVDSGSTRPVDLWRGFLQVASAAAEREKSYDRVVLARNGAPVFHLEGNDFIRVGEERSLGQNPVYQLRTLPEKLYLPNGKQAFGTWTGGMLGVVKEQMEDLNEASMTWVQGEAASKRQ